MLAFPVVTADSEQDMPGIEPGPLGWHTSTLTTELQQVRQGNSHYAMVEFKGGSSTSGNVYATNLDGFYGPVCDDSWDDNDARVVCRQLGYSTGVFHAPFGSVADAFSMDNVNCAGI